MSILDGWGDLIQEVESLAIGGEPLVVTFDDIKTLRYALVALVIFNSKLETKGHPWGYTLDTQGHTTLVVRKISS